MMSRLKLEDLAGLSGRKLLSLLERRCHCSVELIGRSLFFYCVDQYESVKHLHHDLNYWSRFGDVAVGADRDGAYIRVDLNDTTVAAIRGSETLSHSFQE